MKRLLPAAVCVSSFLSVFWLNAPHAQNSAAVPEGLRVICLPARPLALTVAHDQGLLSKYAIDVQTLVAANSEELRKQESNARARLAEMRPGVREIRIRYGNGGFYNSRPRRFKAHVSLRRHIRLHAEHGELVLELPHATEALVPHVLGPAKAGRHAK